MQFFYSNNIINDNENLGKVIILDKVDSNHCINVLRYKISDEIFVVDGLGNLYRGIIRKVEKKKCIVNVENITHTTHEKVRK